LELYDDQFAPPSPPAKSVLELTLSCVQISSVCVFMLWLLVAAATIRDLATGGKKLFTAQGTNEAEHRKQSEKLEDTGEKMV